MNEVEYRTPNGLHDAYLLGLSVDYEKRILCLDLDWLVGTPEERKHGEKSAYQRGKLIIHDLRYCVIEPPVKGDGEKPDQINGFVTDDADVVGANLPNVEAGVFRHTLYLGYWTSFIHFAGTSAEVFPAELIVREMSA